MLRIAADVIAPSLTFIFNLLLSTGIFDDDCKNARVTPIYKDGSKLVMGNYRPISLQLPILSKIFEQEIFMEMDNGELTGVVFLDIQKAFGST